MAKSKQKPFYFKVVNKKGFENFTTEMDFGGLAKDCPYQSIGRVVIRERDPEQKRSRGKVIEEKYFRLGSIIEREKARLYLNQFQEIVKVYR
jgi:hypothetical protein